MLSEFYTWFLSFSIEARIAIIALSLSILGLTVKGLIMLWRWLVFRWRSSIYLGVLGIRYYLRDIPILTIMDNEEYVETLPGLFIPATSYPGLKNRVEYFILKLDMQNNDSQEDRILSCKLCPIRPKSVKLEVIPSYELQFRGLDLGNSHELQNDVEFPVKDFFTTPLVLEPKKTYTKYLCIRIIRFPKLIDKTEIEICMKSRSNKKSKVRIKFKRDNEQVSLIHK